MESSRALLLKVLGGLLLLAAATWLFLHLIRSEATVVAAVRGPAPNAVAGSVTVLAERSLEVKSDVAGRVIKKNMELSDPVPARGILVELDPADLNLQIEQLESERATVKRRIEIGSASQFELITARELLETDERQHKEGTFTLVDLEKQRRAVKTIEQKLELDKVINDQQLSKIENDLKVAHRTLEKMTLRSPVEGVVTAIHTDVGDLISIGQPVATIIADSRIVEVKISEENFAGLRIGQPATVRFLSYGNKQYSGKIAKILPAADPLTQRYIVHLTVDVDPKLLVPGITGEANIVVDLHENAIIIPRRALMGRNVFVVKGGRIELRQVEVGFTSLNQVEIRRGVEAGELVVVEETDRFRAGDRVTTIEVKS